MWRPLNPKRLPRPKQGYCLLVQDNFNVKADLFMAVWTISTDKNGNVISESYDWITYGNRYLSDVLSFERTPEICTYKVIKL
jgi:hypothetical protein